MSNKNKHLRGVVYSTNPDFQFRTEKEEEETDPGARHQQLRVHIEKNHRGGKTVTLVKGFHGPASLLEDLGRKLKQRCGAGGTAKDGIILIQGERKEQVVSLLKSWGYHAK